MRKNKSFVFRLYPNKEQEITLNKTFGCCRFVYNQMLAEYMKSYKQNKILKARSVHELKEEYTFLSDVDSHALNRATRHLFQAYQNFFKNSKHFNLPKFKSKKNSKKSYETYGAIRVLDDYIQLPKIKLIKAKVHRKIPDNYKIKSATVYQNASGKFYVSILCEYNEDVNFIVPNINKSIGIDYKSNGLGITSNGDILSNHRYFRENQSKLAKEQNKLSRKKTGSKNYNKQKIKVAKIHEHIANQRKDNAHKLSHYLSNKYDIICLEDINLQEIAKEKYLGKATYDNGFGMFRDMLKYKMEDRGKYLIYIDKYDATSTVCSNCGAYHKDIVNSLDIREWICPDCNAKHDRDINAAKNILQLGLQRL